MLLPKERRSREIPKWRKRVDSEDRRSRVGKKGPCP